MNASLPQVLILLELLSVAFVLMYIFFAAKGISIAWLFGIVASVLSVILFYKKALYGSAALNVIYALQGVFGFIQWQWFLNNQLPSYKWKLQKHIVTACVTLIIAFLCFKLLKVYNVNEFNTLDIVLALFCIVATYLESKKDISSWNYWMVCNVAYGILYFTYDSNEGGNIYIYASLMLFLAVFSYFAKRKWLKMRASVV